MNESQTKQLVRKNTLFWIVAMVLPGIFDLSFKAFASPSAKFPWPMILPFMMLGLLLASNSLITEAAGAAKESPDDQA